MRSANEIDDWGHKLVNMHETKATIHNAIIAGFLCIPLVYSYVVIFVYSHYQMLSFYIESPVPHVFCYVSAGLIRAKENAPYPTTV